MEAPMANITLLEKALPIAPLKIAALDSCKELGQKVNDYIVSFRQNAVEQWPDSASIANYLALVQVKRKEFFANLFVAQICLSWWMCATTV